MIGKFRRLVGHCLNVAGTPGTCWAWFNPRGLCCPNYETLTQLLRSASKVRAELLTRRSAEDSWLRTTNFLRLTRASFSLLGNNELPLLLCKYDLNVILRSDGSNG